MRPEDLLAQRQATLLQVLRDSYSTGSPHSRAFARRVLHDVSLGRAVALTPPASGDLPQSAAYYGIPDVALLGFRLGDGTATAGDVATFHAAFTRLRHRSTAGLATLLADDVALLGIADGLAQLLRDEYPQVDGARTWLLELIEMNYQRNQWSSRLRSLAGDLLDGRGRLCIVPDIAHHDILAADLALRQSWPTAYSRVPVFDAGTRESLLHHLLADAPPRAGDLERAAVHLTAVDALVRRLSQSLITSVSETAAILWRVQHSLKRWRWAEHSRRRIAPSRWLIDDEYDVQALLWAVLYPIYRADLVDETYLPSWGNVQPRVDLGITSLKLIIEVKIARDPADFKKIEEQVAGDEGLYFKDVSQFDRMLVFVYDDSDRPQPERYASLRNALSKRARIEDVVIVQRPSMMPSRNARRELGSISKDGV